jgi:choline dehydrogenase-like flavoprotein
VVDPRLRVHRIARLRVADASIMIGEKCAPMILEDAVVA